MASGVSCTTSLLASFTNHLLYSLAKECRSAAASLGAGARTGRFIGTVYRAAGGASVPVLLLFLFQIVERLGGVQLDDFLRREHAPGRLAG